MVHSAFRALWFDVCCCWMTGKVTSHDRNVYVPFCVCRLQLISGPGRSGTHRTVWAGTKHSSHSNTFSGRAAETTWSRHEKQGERKRRTIDILTFSLYLFFCGCVFRRQHVFSGSKNFAVGAGVCACCLG